MKNTIKREARKISTWGIVLAGIASVGAYVPAIAPFVSPLAAVVILGVTGIAKAVQNKLQEDASK